MVSSLPVCNDFLYRVASGATPAYPWTASTAAEPFSIRMSNLLQENNVPRHNDELISNTLYYILLRRSIELTTYTIGKFGKTARTDMYCILTTRVAK